MQIVLLHFHSYWKIDKLYLLSDPTTITTQKPLECENSAKYTLHMFLLSPWETQMSLSWMNVMWSLLYVKCLCVCVVPSSQLSRRDLFYPIWGARVLETNNAYTVISCHGDMFRWKTDCIFTNLLFIFFYKFSHTNFLVAFRGYLYSRIKCFETPRGNTKVMGKRYKLQDLSIC